MAKIITENFRVESANEFVKSYRTNNEAVVRSFQDGLEIYNSELPEQWIEGENTEDGAQLRDAQVASITSIARQNINTILPQNTYYVMASGYDEDGEISNTQKDKREFQRRVIFGNKIDETNIRYMFPTNDWVTGTVYQSFDDTVDLENENYYVTVLDGDITEASYKVFKCIRNNGGSPSTVRPSTANLDVFFETTLEDGYVWKYMFEVPPSEYLVFATSSTLPYIADTDVIDAAVETISDIIIENTDAGVFFDYLVGDKSPSSTTPTVVTLETAEVDSEPDNTYRLSITSSNAVRPQLGAYKNMYLRIVSTGEVFEILNTDIPNDPNIDAATNKVLVMFVKSDTDITGRAGLEVEIVPIVELSQPDADANGTQAIAYGVLDNTGTLTKVNFVTKGSGYKNATATLKLPPSVASRIDNNNLRPVISPTGGHGSDPINELFMSNIAVYTNFFTDSLRNTPSTNTYTKIGLVKNPEFFNGTTPLTFDNRVKLTFNVDVEANFPVGSIVSQVVNGQTLSGIVHEVQWSPDDTETSVWLTDTIGPYNETFTTAECEVRASSEANEFETFVINNVVTEKYKPYTGQILHFVNFAPIERTQDRREKIKLVFDF